MAVNPVKMRISPQSKVMNVYQEEVKPQERGSRWAARVSQDRVNQDRLSENQMELELKRVEAQLNAISRIFEQRYQFTVDKETNQLVMKVVDITSGKVIRQIPSEEMLKLAAQMNRMIGIFMDHLV